MAVRDNNLRSLITMRNTTIIILLLSGLILSGCATKPANNSTNGELVGAWRAKIQFGSGAFASVKDLEFMYVFNAGGTMTESSNYDGAPPVPPAYGVWRQTGPHEFEAKYVFYSTKPPTKFEDITSGGGWLPSGRGVLREVISVAEDGRHYRSKIQYETFDTAGKRVEGGGVADGVGERIGF